MITVKEARELMRDEREVFYEGIRCRKITAISYRKGKDSFVPFVELLDENTNSVIVTSSLNKIDMDENSEIGDSAFYEIFEKISDIEKNLEQMKISLIHENLEQVKHNYNKALKSLLVLDKGIADVKEKKENQKIIDTVNENKDINTDSEKEDMSNLMDDYIAYKEAEKDLEERTELFDEDDPETKKKLEEFEKELEEGKEKE